MYPFTHEQYYALERQKTLLDEPLREQVNLSSGQRFSGAREVLQRAVNQFWQSLAREGEICLELEPACEMRFV
jgi:hypothetical protein